MFAFLNQYDCCVLRTHAESSKSTSSETDLNDNLPSHRTPTSTTSLTKHTSHNGFFQHHQTPASAPSFYDSPPSRGASLSNDGGIYHLPRSHSQDTVLLSRSAPSPQTHQDSGDASDLYVFNTPTRKASMETQMRNLSVSYDIPPTPGANSTYQVPRTLSTSAGLGSSESGGDVVPPPRPPKPSLGSMSGLPPPPAERSPTDTYCVPRSASETDGNYCVPTSAGSKALRSNTIGTVDSSRLRKGLCWKTNSSSFFSLKLSYSVYSVSQNIKCNNWKERDNFINMNYIKIKGRWQKNQYKNSRYSDFKNEHIFWLSFTLPSCGDKSHCTSYI